MVFIGYETGPKLHDIYFLQLKHCVHSLWRKPYASEIHGALENSTVHDCGISCLYSLVYSDSSKHFYFKTYSLDYTKCKAAVI